METLPSESRLEIREIKKDFQNGNFFLKKGTKIKGEILTINNKAIFRWYNQDKNALDSAKKGALGVVLNQDIPLEYFDSSKKNEDTKYVKANYNTIFIYSLVAFGSILIYKYFIKK